jgi:hypothetical protein
MRATVQLTTMPVIQDAHCRKQEWNVSIGQLARREVIDYVETALATREASDMKYRRHLRARRQCG